MGISKCSLFEGPLPSTLFRKTSLGLPDRFLSEERWFKKRMGVKNEFNRFFPFSQSSSALVRRRGICTWRGYLKEIEKAFSYLQSEIY